MAQINEDCAFFLSTGCNKGDACLFRHSQAVKDNANASVCNYWLNGHCSRLSCQFRHPTLPKQPVAPFPAMPQLMAGCKYFMQGTCRNGAACPFGHGYQAPMFAPQQQFRQQQQQQQQFRQQPQQQQRQKRERPPANETEDEKRERLLSKPLPPVRSKKMTALPGQTVGKAAGDAAANKGVVGGSGSVVVITKKKRVDDSAEAAPAATSAQQQDEGKAARAKLASAPLPVKKVEEKPTAAANVKSLAQIMAEKNAAPKKDNLDAELLALGIAPSTTTPKSASATTTSAAATSASSSGSKYDQELLAMGLDLDDFKSK